MIRGLYTAVSGLITLENKQNTIANNMANSNTIGFKSDELGLKSFKEVLVSNKDKILGNQNVKQDLGKLALGVETDRVDTVFTQGDFKNTGKIGDFAIDGRGFFTVQRGNERLYTRDGNFRVGTDGNLITTTGDKVLGVNKNTGRVEPIFVGNSKFQLNKSGELEIPGKPSYKLLTADFNDYKSLKKVGDNYYKGENPITDANVKVNQGYLELSNVDITDSMVDMLAVMRNFETNQKFVTMMDDSLGKAANDIGQVR
ncbi:flagellar hook-basal body complex protein [Clostridium chrysemydis]|uniref:flagellar hook-basal body complex protein n=1 Tax=Clostridium chrysemydis TaxID=2665504 RepID=UPI001883834A|nr:flagellar hook-basal body complex protein [Clostridium chrysemydis]